MSGQVVQHLSGLHGPIRAPASPTRMHALGNVGIGREVLALPRRAHAAQLAVPQRRARAVHAFDHCRGVLRLANAPGPRQGPGHHEQEAAAKGHGRGERRKPPRFLVRGDRVPLAVRVLASVKF